jgi:hypothetical protein
MATSKLQRGFNKMTILQQEQVLAKKLQEMYLVVDEITKALAKVRGGYKYEVTELVRPDLEELKV